MSEVAELLRELIRVDTTNPPGNETAAAELLRAHLEGAGVECKLYSPIRGNGCATRSAASSSKARSGVAARST